MKEHTDKNFENRLTTIRDQLSEMSAVVEKIGIDPIHFAAIVGTNLGLGNISPPCAPLLYMAGGVTKMPLNEYVGPTLKFLLLGHLPMVFIVTFVPELSLFLPSLLD